MTNQSTSTIETNAKIDRSEPLTMSVPEAGKKYFNLERQASYSAAKRGDIITVRVGGKLRAITAAMDAKMLRL